MAVTEKGIDNVELLRLYPEIHTDMKWMKKKIERMDKSMHGNGQPGFIESTNKRMDGFDNFKSYLIGIGSMVSVGLALLAILL